MGLGEAIGTGSGEAIATGTGSGEATAIATGEDICILWKWARLRINFCYKVWLDGS